MTFITGRIPFTASFGAGSAASDPSPRNNGPSAHFVSWAASRMVNGRTLCVVISFVCSSNSLLSRFYLTQTEIDEASVAAMVLYLQLLGCTLGMAGGPDGDTMNEILRSVYLV